MNTATADTSSSITNIITHTSALKGSGGRGGGGQRAVEAGDIRREGGRKRNMQMEARLRRGRKSWRNSVGVGNKRGDVNS